jgi:protein-disulfide isomerase
LKRACVAAVLGLLTLGACERTAAEDDAFGARVRAYLLSHPEVIQEAVDKLQQKADADEAAAQDKARRALPAFRAAVERDPRDYVANPDGKITVTEFYDYRCAHCINAAPKVLALIAANPDLRFVFKESPIFGPTSELAARAAIAIKKSGGDYLGYYKTMMATRGLDAAAIDRLALAHGAKAADLGPSPAADKQIADVSSLFTKLDLGGTPAFIVGNEIVFGEDMEALNAAIVKARAAKG